MSLKLAYHNAFLYGITDGLRDTLQRIQRIQSTAARTVTGTRRSEDITPILCKLRWLPVRFRVQFKSCLLTNKATSFLSRSAVHSLFMFRPVLSVLRGGKKLVVQPRHCWELAESVLQPSCLECDRDTRNASSRADVELPGDYATVYRKQGKSPPIFNVLTQMCLAKRS